MTGQLDSLGRISIHSAARAETFSSGSSSVGIIHFNPLRREGGDVMPVDKVRKRDIFQSTPPRGRRRYHKRGDTVMQIISIHSAARAETFLP